MPSISRAAYAAMYGPTTGDRIRLADTELWIAVEKDYAVYGEEITTSALGVARDGMGRFEQADPCDLVLANAVILHHLGVVKADIGIKGDRIVAIGKAGNPNVQPQVDVVIGSLTTVLDLAGLIVTPGLVALDVPVSAALGFAALAESGVTTVIGGGGGASGVSMSPPSGNAQEIQSVLEAALPFPMNLLISLSANSSDAAGPKQATEYGVAALRLSDQAGITPAVIDAVLQVADKHDVALILEGSNGNESGSPAETLDALKGRTTIFCGIDSTEGGTPSQLTLVGAPHVLPSVRISSIPFTLNRLDNLLDARLAYDDLGHIDVVQAIALAEAGLAREIIAALDILLDCGAVPMVSASRMLPELNGQILLKLMQGAHKMKVQRSQLPEDERRGDNADNVRVMRWLAKCTINPAIACGIADQVGSIEAGKLADLVVWHPADFAARPFLIFKSGERSYSAETGLTANRSALLFTSQAAIDEGQFAGLNLDALTRRVVPVRHVRQLSRRDMILNDWVPRVEVNEETLEVRADWVLLHCEPATVLPLAQRYFL